MIENAFGILSARWRILHKPIRGSVENVEKYILACLTLHNYLRLTENATYSPIGFIDSEDSSGNILPGTWRSEAAESGALVNIRPVRGSRYCKDAVAVREILKEYVNSEEGHLSWQLEYIRRTSNKGE